MKKLLSILGVLLLSFGWLMPVQAKIEGEHYIHFIIKDRSEINKITRMISIDNVKGNEVWAYTNDKELANFKNRGYQYEELMHPTDVAVSEKRTLTMATTTAQMANWDRYPTYEVYVQMMNNLAITYPNLCKVEEIGTSVNSRKLLAIKISDNVQTDEDEPEVFYSNTMHGDETTGYILLLRLADYLATNYGNNTRVANLVNNLEIFIAPDTNPDGTYNGGNSNIAGAKRYNGNDVDLNRNYPDFVGGPHTDGEAWQPETIATMNYAKNHHFIMGFNGHGGAEVVNYPWDTKPQLSPDDIWWQAISQAYVDTCRKVYPNYMSSLYPSGITNGYAWYEANGSRQDWMNYYAHCREVTIEFSNTKLLGTENLNSFWGYNKNALLAHMEWCFKGIKGHIVDGGGNAMHNVQVKLLNHDSDSTEVYTEQHGAYYRLIQPGTYNMQFSYNGISKTVNNVVVPATGMVTVDVTLQSISDVPSFGDLTGNTATPGNPLNLNLTVTTDSQVPEYVKATYTIDGNSTTVDMTAAKLERHYLCTIPAQNATITGSVIFKSKYPGKPEVTSSEYEIKWLVEPLFSESFEGEWAPTGWTVGGTTSASYNWNRDDSQTSGGYTPAGANGTAHSAKYHSYMAAENSTGELITKVFSLPTLNEEAYYLNFYYINKAYSSGNADKMEVFFSTNNGTSWGSAIKTCNTADSWQINTINIGNPNSTTCKVKFVATSDYGYTDIGLDEVKITIQSVSILSDKVVAKQIQLQQNYPNPFNPETVIKYSLADAANINLAVYNIKGELVTTLFNGNQSAGLHAVKFDGSNLNSGIYIYKLTAGNNSFIGKMTLIK